MIRPTEGAALLIAATALAVTWLRSGNEPTQPGAPPDVARLEQRVALLTEKLDELEQPPLAEPTAPPVAPSHEVLSDPELIRRVAAAEGDLSALRTNFDLWVEATTANEAPKREDRDVAESPLALETMGHFQELLRDPNADPYTRATAIATLRRFPVELLPLEPVIDDIATLLTTTESRAGLERLVDEVDGIRDERFVAPLLHLLEHHPVDGVRFEVLDALRPFTDHPAVRPALEAAASGPEGRTRDRAAGMLEILRGPPR